MSTTVFERARIVDPSRGIDEVGSVIVDGRKILAAGKAALNQGAPEGAATIDCAGKAIIPGLIDGRVFIGEPGGEHRETIASASVAAAAGGVTSVVMMPDTDPVIDNVALVEFVLRTAKDDAMVMHPGPMNRGVEIASEIADGPQSVIQEQVEMGVAVRMAVMEALLDPRRNQEGRGA